MLVWYLYMSKDCCQYLSCLRQIILGNFYHQLLEVEIQPHGDVYQVTTYKCSIINIAMEIRVQCNNIEILSFVCFSIEAKWILYF